MLRFRERTGTRGILWVTAFAVGLGANRCASAADETRPTPAEVGAANDAAWESIAFIDMEYVVSTRLVEQGRVVVERESGLNRWVRTPTHERLLLRDLDGKGLAVDRLVGESVIRLLQYPVDMDFTADPIRPCDDPAGQGDNFSRESRRAGRTCPAEHGAAVFHPVHTADAAE